MLPAVFGTLSWDWLWQVTGSGHEYGIHPLWIYIWHPPLMDFLFGVLVLAGFVESRCWWWLLASSLGILSFLVHSIAVFSVINTQWLLGSLIDLRFASVIPVTLLATILLASATGALAGIVSRRLIAYSIAAGFLAGLVFLVALETTDSTGWFWRNNLHWMFWHMSLATAIHFGTRARKPVPARRDLANWLP